MLMLMSLGLLLTIVMFNVVLGASFSNFNVVYAKGSLFGIDSLTGAIGIIVILITVSAIIGIQILGSGIAGESIRVIIRGVAYGGIWVLFSVLGMNLIISIELFGGIIYIFLTILYTIGVIIKFN